jgi:hypothetical protein
MKGWLLWAKFWPATPKWQIKEEFQVRRADLNDDVQEIPKENVQHAGPVLSYLRSLARDRIHLLERINLQIQMKQGI